MPPQKHKIFKPDRILEFCVNDQHHTSLLDFLFSALAHCTKTTVKSFLKHNQVKVNQTVTTQFDFPLKVGDNVYVNMTREWPALKNPRLKIV